MAQDPFRTSVSKPPFRRTPESPRRGRRRAPLRTRRDPRASASSRLRVHEGLAGPWECPDRSGGVRAARRPPDDPRPGCVPSRGPLFGQAVATPQGRAPSRPSPRCRKAVEPTCDPSKDPQTRPESPSRARWPGLNKAPPSQAWRGVELRKEGPCNGPDLTKPGSRPT